MENAIITALNFRLSVQTHLVYPAHRTAKNASLINVFNAFHHMLSALI